MASKNPNTFRTFFFIESHPKSKNAKAEVKLDMKHQGVQPLRKLLEKDFRSPDGQEDFTACVYAGDLIPNLLKDKEIKTINGNIKTFPVKMVLKIDKNKFETKIQPYLESDCFLPFIKFEPMKKLVGKNIDPPPQIQLHPLQFFPLFSDALIIKERKKLNDPTYLQFLKFGVDIMKTFQPLPLRYFLMIYEKIMNCWNLDLLNYILGFFHLKIFDKVKSREEISSFEESLMLIYDEQAKYIENIRRIPNVDFILYLIKFYTVIIYYHAALGNMPKVESIILDLRDKNPYDPLILARMFLSDFNVFFRSIPLNIEIKISMIDNYIQASNTYDNLLCAFSMITEYVQGDLNQILLIVIKNYDQIHKICIENNQVFLINDYIRQRPDDDLGQVQQSLITLGQNKLKYGYSSISFRYEMWDMYLTQGRNPEFLEFLKEHLIQTALNTKEINDALDYLIRFTHKNMNAMLELFVKNYDKIEYTCKRDNLRIKCENYIQPTENDNIAGIKENLNFIVERKLKLNYEIFYFKIDIWLFYITNQFNNEFLLYLEEKLFEGSLYFADIKDCLTFSTNLRNKDFVAILDIITKHFDKITTFFMNRKEYIDISHYFVARPGSDNLEEIYKLISAIIQSERMKNYRTIDFKIGIWEPYSQLQNLTSLRLVRKIIIELSIMDSTLTETDLNLPKKIHDCGLLYIRTGKLVGDQLLSFLGFEEAFYVDGQINSIIETLKLQQKQLDDHLRTINFLVDENNKLKGRVNVLENDVSFLKRENSNLQSRVGTLESRVSSLRSDVSSLESQVNSLRWRT